MAASNTGLDAVVTHRAASAKKASDENAVDRTRDSKIEVVHHVLLLRRIEIVIIRANILR